MERFPLLALTLRYGGAGAFIVALLAGIIVAAATWPALGVLACALGASTAAIAYAVARGFVELVTIVTEMLVPR